MESGDLNSVKLSCYSVGCSSLSTSGEFGTEDKLCPEVLQSLVAWCHINPGLYCETGVEI